MSKNGKKQGGIILKKYNKIIGLLLAVALLLPGMATKVSAAENDVTRLAGDNRIETSIKISKDAYVDGSATEVVLAGWEGKADALTGTYLASAKKAPLLFTRDSSVEANLLAELKRLGAKTVYVLGGTTVIKDSVVTALETAGMTVVRVNGENRFETAGAVAKKANATAKHVFLANGWGDLTDALAAGPASAKEGMPVLLTETNALRTETVAAMKNLGVEKVTILGGVNAVSKAIEDKLVADLGSANVNRVSGDNRFATANAIAAKYFVGATKAIVANSEGMPDALVAGYFGALRNAPILLTPAATLHATTAAYLEANVNEAYIVGGTAAVNAKVETDVKTAITPVDAAVVSVSAINAKQLEVKFSVAVDKTTAENEDLYFIQRTSDASPVKLSTVDTTAVADFQEDGKTVIITTTSDIETSFSISGATTPFKFSVDGVKTATKEAIEAKTFTISVSDTVAPTFVSASASAKTTTNNITLKFSEPVVATSGVVRVNGVAASVAPGSSPTELTVTTGTNLASGSSYEVELLNFKDFAGNFLTPNPVKTSFTVASNVIAPTISDVKVVRDNLVEVTFDKAMKTSSLSNVSVRLLDGNYTNIAPTNIVSVLAKANTSNRVFQITLDNSPALPFNNGVFTGTLVFTDSIEDSVGNTLNTTNRVVSISEDTTAPSVASVSFKKADTTGATYGGVVLTNGAVVIKFNEGVAKAVSSVGALKLIDNNGNDVTSTYIIDTQIAAAQVNPNDNTELVIPFKTALTTAANISSFTLRLPSGVATDLSLAANSSNSSVNSFNVEAGTNTSGDTVKPVIVSATPKANNEIVVAVTELNLDNSSAINLNNYRLDGAPLPTGTYVTVTGTAPNYVIHLHLPAGSISESRDYALNVSGIKDTAGNIANMFVDNTVALVDDVMPQLKTATLNTNGSLTLGYSEALATVIAANDLKITLNGKIVNSSQLNLVVGTGGETGKDVLTVKQLVDKGTDSSYGGGDDTLYIDVDGTVGYTSGTDILISTGSFSSTHDGAVYDLRNATTLKVGTITSPVTADDDGNKLKGNTTITVK